MNSISIHHHILYILTSMLLIFSTDSIVQVNGQSSTNQYHPNVVGLTQDGLIKGRDAMNSFLQDFNKEQGAVVHSQSRYTVQVLQVLEYEIRTFHTEKGGQFANLIIWSNENGSQQKILDVVYKKSPDHDVPSELEEARLKWVKLCGEKSSENLVTQLYTEDAIYYNRGRILKGHSQLTQEYKYMESPSYTLDLTPEHIEMVTDEVIFEIGMCSGSYPLPYILIWKKQKDDSWKIYMDSNY